MVVIGFILQANGQLILEGVLRIYWGVQNVIHLKEEDSARIQHTSQRPVSQIIDATMYNDSDEDVSSNVIFTYLPKC